MLFREFNTKVKFNIKINKAFLQNCCFRPYQFLNSNINFKNIYDNYDKCVNADKEFTFAARLKILLRNLIIKQLNKFLRLCCHFNEKYVNIITNNVYTSI